MELGTLRKHLDRIARTFGPGHLDSDPVGLLHRFSDPIEIEVGGVFAAGLALGRARTIREKITELFERLDGRPARTLESESPAGLRKRLAGFRHRFFGENDLVTAAWNAGRMIRERGALRNFWPQDLPFRDALSGFAAEFSRPSRGMPPPRTSGIPFFGSPARGSATKRSLMYLRWMSRPADGVDFGLWSSPKPSELVIPLDTHVFRISRLVGLTSRRTPSWTTAVEVTDTLRLLDADDPVRFDFSLSRLGIVRGCRGRRVDAVCGGCGLREVCSAYRGATVRNARCA